MWIKPLLSKNIAFTQTKICNLITGTQLYIRVSYTVVDYAFTRVDFTILRHTHVYDGLSLILQNFRLKIYRWHEQV